MGATTTIKPRGDRKRCKRDKARLDHGSTNCLAQYSLFDASTAEWARYFRSPHATVTSSPRPSSRIEAKYAARPPAAGPWRCCQGAVPSAVERSDGQSSSGMVPSWHFAKAVLQKVEG